MNFIKNARVMAFTFEFWLAEVSGRISAQEFFYILDWYNAKHWANHKARQEAVRITKKAFGKGY